MTLTVGVITGAILFIIAAVHVYWAFGGVWPAASEAVLADAVVGDRRRTEMPSMLATLVMAALIATAGLIALLLGFGRGPTALLRLAAAGLALVFGGRALLGLGLALGVVPYPATETFARLDARFYSPLCAVLGLAFVLLAVTASDDA